MMNRKQLRFAAALAWAAVLLVAVTGSAGASEAVDQWRGINDSDTVRVTQAETSGWLDTFDGGVLDPAWIWINENPEKWSLTEVEWYLRIYSSSLPTGGENLLLTSAIGGDFAIETRVLFAPYSNFQLAGLVIFQDEANFVQFGRAYCDVESACVGNGIYFDRLGDGAFVGSNFATTVDQPSEAYLRLQREGQKVTGYYSDDGVSWLEIGRHYLPLSFSITGVGLTASQDYDDTDEPIPADFDYFSYTEDLQPSPPVVAPNQPTAKSDCKDGGWQNYPSAGFRNQGDCIQFVNTGKYDCRDALGCVIYPHGDPLRLATALAISGDLGFLGVDSQRGVEIALARHSQILGRGLELRDEDSGCFNPELAEAAANAIVSDPSIAAVIGTTCSVDAFTVAPVLSRAGYSMISPSNTAPALTHPDTHDAGYLRTASNDARNADAMAEYVIAEEMQTAAVIVQREAPASEAIGQAFVDSFESLGGTVGIPIDADPDGTDVDEVVDAVLSAGTPEVLYFPVFEPLGSAIVDAVRARPEFDGTVLASNDYLYSQEFLDAHGSQVVGMLFGLPDTSFTESEAYAEFREQYLSAYGEEPLVLFSAHAFDATIVILHAIEQIAILDGESTLYIGRQALRDALFATEGLEGLTGTISCDEFGDCSATGFIIIQVEPPSPHFTVFPDWQWLEGYGWPDGALVTAAVAGKPECETGETSWDGFFGVGFPEGCTVEVGDVVTLVHGTTTRTHIVQNFEILDVIETSGEVSGTIVDFNPDLYVLHAWIHEVDESYMEVPVEGSNWTANFDPADLGPGVCGRVEVNDQQGNGTAHDWCIPNPRFTVFPEWEWMDGIEWPDGLVTVTVADKPECWNQKISQDGFFNGPFPPGCDVMVGDVVAFDDGTTTRTHTVQDLAVTVADPAANVLAGTAGSGSVVHVWVHEHNEETEMALEVGDDGTWTADFSPFELAEEVCGRSEIRDEFGNSTAVDWCAASGPRVTIGNFDVEWSPSNPEEVVSLRWMDGPNLTNAWTPDWASEDCGDLEFFGNGWVSENEGGSDFFFASLVGLGSTGTWSIQSSTEIAIDSASTSCPGSGNMPVSTQYRFFSDRANLIEVRRTIDFGDLGYTHDIRPFIPRLYPADGFTEVLHPSADGTSLMADGTCGYGCVISDWDGTWYAIHDPSTGVGMIVQHQPAEFSPALWADDDGGSFTNASSVLLLQPPGGFTGQVSVTQYLCFYDSEIWTPSLNLPTECEP